MPVRDWVTALPAASTNAATSAARFPHLPRAKSAKWIANGCASASVAESSM